MWGVLLVCCWIARDVGDLLVGLLVREVIVVVYCLDRGLLVMSDCRELVVVCSGYFCGCREFVWILGCRFMGGYWSIWCCLVLAFLKVG